MKTSYMVIVIIDGDQYGGAVVEGKKALKALKRSLAKLGNREDFQLEVTELQTPDALVADLTELFRDEGRDE